MCLVWQQTITCCSCYRTPKNVFFSTNSFGQSKIDHRHTHFFILHHLSPVIFANATVVAFLLLHNSGFNFHCYTQREPTTTQNRPGSGGYELSRLLARNITKGNHSCKPASLKWQTGETSPLLSEMTAACSGVTIACVGFSCNDYIYMTTAGFVCWRC